MSKEAFKPPEPCAWRRHYINPVCILWFERLSELIMLTICSQFFSEIKAVWNCSFNTVNHRCIKPVLQIMTWAMAVFTIIVIKALPLCLPRARSWIRKDSHILKLNIYLHLFKVSDRVSLIHGVVSEPCAWGVLINTSGLIIILLYFVT